ncbi:MAG: protein phosphatase 2C domain-containing protein [Chloroflexi bacterium]|nr:protein phosphatase 2C domain-containing protein [Chloroflexota bacterium]
MFFQWAGSQSFFFDSPHVDTHSSFTIGRYGGNTRGGAQVNEDGLVLMSDEDWEFAAILDGHQTAQSVELVIETLMNQQTAIREIFTQPVRSIFRDLQFHLHDVFSSPEFLKQSGNIRGETSLLMAARCEHYLWWMNIGDCVLYLLHPELASLGQYALNERSRFEWIGYVNTFEEAVPAYSTGVRVLREGWNRFLLITDGLFGDERFKDASFLYEHFKQPDSLPDVMHHALHRVHKAKGRDSTTMIGWDYENATPAPYPSRR